MKRFSSGLAVFLGFLGLLMCIALILGLWVFNSRINQSIATFITPVENIISSVNDRSGSLVTQIQMLQDDVIADLLARTTALKTSPQEVEIDTKSILESLESKLEPAIEMLRSELSGIQSQLSAALQFLSLVKTALPQDMQVMIDSGINERVKTSTESLDSAWTKLQDAKTELSTLNLNTDIQRLEGIENAYQTINTRLTEINTLIQGLETTTNRMQTALQTVKQRIHQYLFSGTLVMNLLTFWAAWAQLALLRHGQQTLRQNG